MRLATTVMLALSLLALPAVAGDKCEKCTCDAPIQDCLNTMVHKLKTTGFIGVEHDSKGHKALIITKVIPGTPAESAGIRAGDELYAINGIRFQDNDHEAIKRIKVPGNEVTCTIKRNGASKEIKLTLAPMPADVMAKHIGDHMMLHAKKNLEKTAKR